MDKDGESITLSIGEWCAMAEDSAGPLPPVWINVVSGSMLPLIRPHKDKMLLVSVPNDTLKVGDIVLFPAKRLSGDYCLHRLFKIDGDRVQTFGDFCMRPDGWLTRDKVIGKVAVIQRGNRAIDCDRPFWLFCGRAWLRLWRLRFLFILPCRATAKIIRKVYTFL